MQMHSAVKAENPARQRYGGPAFAPMLRSSMRAPNPRGSDGPYNAPRTREEAEEEDIYNAVWDD